MTEKSRWTGHRYLNEETQTPTKQQVRDTKTQKTGASPDQEKENTDAIKETSQRDQEVVWN